MYLQLRRGSTWQGSRFDVLCYLNEEKGEGGRKQTPKMHNEIGKFKVSKGVMGKKFSRKNLCSFIMFAKVFY